MRHGQKGYKLGRTHAHRQATLAALSNALIKHKRIQTTLTKAKALRIYVEPLITRSKEDTTHNRRQVFRYLQDKHSVTELFSEIAERIAERHGGYTRVVKLGQRSGDGAEMAIIELVDFNETETATTGRRRRTRRSAGRRRRSKGEAATTAAVAEETAEVVEEAAEDTGVVEAVADVAEDVVDTVKETVEEAVDTAKEVIEQAVETSAEIVEEIIDDAPVEEDAEGEAAAPVEEAPTEEAEASTEQPEASTDDADEDEEKKEE